MPMTASITSSSYDQDRLIAGPSDELISRQITLITGETRSRGTLLGKTATAGTIAGAAQAGNTGNGTITGLTVGGAAKEGRYRAVCIEPGTNVGTFALFDPNGIEVGTAVVAVAFSGPVNFTINDGAADFVSGDTFNIDVSAVTYKYKMAVQAATDGSQYPDAILVDDTDASAADKVTNAYFLGQFNSSRVTFGAGLTAVNTRETLRNKGIHLIDVIGA